MNMNRRQLCTALLVAGAAGAPPFVPAVAQGSGAAEGKDYTKVETPQPTNAPPGKVEVLEFFSYACPHCSAFEPSLEAWEKQAPPEIALRRVPVPFLMNADNFIHTYYALETIGAVKDAQLKIFRGIHIEHQRLDTPENIAAYLGKNGVDSAKFLAAFKSFSVATSASKAKKMVADYKVESVPTLVVAGRWMTSPSTAGSQERALQVVEQLAQKARSAK
ncbi:MAG: thiol:disulfide interchange protein DsbA/DsbL [Rhizobacter sp.]|nr:thiol:disulfide interchange protein DsbA/DsbL [Rhizobacter sp.]